MAARCTHVVLAHDLVSEIDRLVGKRQRSEFLAEAASRELLRPVEGRGITLTLMDAFLAVLALRRGLALLTDHARHFPMKGLVVWTPRDVLAQ